MGPVASATPRAVETTPSMPLAPRLASTRARVLVPNASTSRTGIDDDTNSVVSTGSASTNRWARAGSVHRGRRRAAVRMAPVARSWARAQAAAQPLVPA